MPGADHNQISSLIDRLGIAAKDCRAATREAHEALTDLRAAMKEARTLIDQVHQVAKTDVAAELDAAVNEQLKRLGDKIHESMNKTSRHIIAEFDRLSKPLMDSFEEMKAAQERIRAEQRG